MIDVATADRPSARDGHSGLPTESEAAVKAALRLEMREVRQAIPAGERARRARLITVSALSLTEIGRAKVVLAFASFGSEVPTAGLLQLLEKAGVTVLLPYLSSGEILATQHRIGDRMITTSYGPREPALRRPFEIGRIEAVITPGLAFDREGGRLGYGRGYYDRFLRRLSGGAHLIGIAFAEQVVREIPLSESDVRVDLVVTDREVIRCREKRRDA